MYIFNRLCFTVVKFLYALRVDDIQLWRMEEPQFGYVTCICLRCSSARRPKKVAKVEHKVKNPTFQINSLQWRKTQRLVTLHCCISCSIPSVYDFRLEIWLMKTCLSFEDLWTRTSIQSNTFFFPSLFFFFASVVSHKDEFFKVTIKKNGIFFKSLIDNNFRAASSSTFIMARFLPNHTQVDLVLTVEQRIKR